MTIESRAEEVTTTDLSDPASAPLGFSMLRSRLELLRRLRSRGFYVRMHGYEYVIGDGKCFVAIVLLEPSRRSAEVIVLDEKAHEVYRVVRELDPSTNVRLRRPSALHPT